MKWHAKLPLEKHSKTENIFVLTAPETEYQEINIVGLGQRIYRRSELERAIKAANLFDLQLEPVQHSGGAH